MSTLKKMSAFVSKLPQTVYEAYEADLDRGTERENTRHCQNIMPS